MLFASVGIALSEAEKAERSASAGVAVRRRAASDAGPTLVATREWTEAERLAHEKAALGFYLSGHPYAAYAPELAPLIRLPLRDLQPRKEPVLIAGIVTAVRVQSSRRGKMAFVTLDDGGAAGRDRRLQRDLRSARSALREDQLVIVEVKVMQRTGDDGEAQGLRIIADAVHDLPAVRKRYAKGLRLACNGGADAGRLAEMLTPVPQRKLSDRRRVPRTAASAASSSCPTRGASTSTIRCSRACKDWLAPENVKVIY